MSEYSSITSVLNNLTKRSIRWCTPSIFLDSEIVKNPYLSDMSVSFEELGFPSEPSGIFLEAYGKAAKAYGADKTVFSVNGTTGSNFIVLRTLAKQIPNLRILASRNIHKSILYACQDYGINLLFIPANIDSQLQIFLPNSSQEIIQAVKRTKPNVVLLTNPTYEGLTLNLRSLIRELREINPKLIIFVDEAWGAHLAFSDKLPLHAMEGGADICVQSTHKQGGSLQQGSMIHWKEGRINSRLLLESYRNLTTSSPSYILLASLDAAREYIEKKGEKKIDELLSIGDIFRKNLETIPGFKIVNLSDLRKKYPSVIDKDETKILVDVSQSGFTGFELGKFLEDKYNIIIEKNNATTLLFLVPFQAKKDHVKVTIQALKDIIKKYKPQHDLSSLQQLEIPRKVPRILELREVSKLLQSQIEVIPLVEAEGRICAENITPYPPGIPTTIQGEEFTTEAIRFYQKIHEYPNSHVLANDITLKTVVVVK